MICGYSKSRVASIQSLGTSEPESYSRMFLSGGGGDLDWAFEMTPARLMYTAWYKVYESCVANSSDNCTICLS